MTLADTVLAAPALKGVKNARVTLTMSVDNGRDDQTFRYFRILTPKPVINLAWTSKAYSCVISDGHDLNATGARNRIDVVKIDRSTPAPLAQMSFEIVLDGQPLKDDEGHIYVFAVRASGPHIFRHPGDSGDPPNDHFDYAGPRYDVHAGNEADYTHTDGEPDRWLRSYVTDVDIELVDAQLDVIHSRPGYKRGHFGG